MDNIIYYDSMIVPKGGLLSAPIVLTIISFISIIILLIVLSVGLINAIKDTSLTLTEKELIIKSPFYGRKIPLENITLSGIRAIDLNENRDYSISRRTNGTSLPNVTLGWMRLRNREKALVFITDKSRVVLIPTKNYLVLFSLNNIDEFINKIKTL